MTKSETEIEIESQITKWGFSKFADLYYKKGTFSLKVSSEKILSDCVYVVISGRKVLYIGETQRDVEVDHWRPRVSALNNRKYEKFRGPWVAAMKPSGIAEIFVRPAKTKKGEFSGMFLSLRKLEEKELILMLDPTINKMGKTKN